MKTITIEFNPTSNPNLIQETFEVDGPIEYADGSLWFTNNVTNRSIQIVSEIIKSITIF